MPFACIFWTSVLDVSNPSTSYIWTDRSADALGGPLSCHCHETVLPGCQHDRQATGAATDAGAVVRAGARPAARTGSHADSTSTTERSDRDASRFLTEQVSAPIHAELDLTARR